MRIIIAALVLSMGASAFARNLRIVPGEINVSKGQLTITGERADQIRALQDIHDLELIPAIAVNMMREAEDAPVKVALMAQALTEDLIDYLKELFRNLCRREVSEIRAEVAGTSEKHDLEYDEALVVFLIESALALDNDDCVKVVAEPTKRKASFREIMCKRVAKFALDVAGLKNPSRN